MIYRPVPAQEVFALLPDYVREAGGARAEHLIEEHGKRLIRKAVRHSKKDSADRSEMVAGLAAVKEAQLWMMIRTLEKTVAPLGGKVRLAVEIPGGSTVTLSLKGRIISKPKVDL